MINRKVGQNSRLDSCENRFRFFLAFLIAFSLGDLTGYLHVN